MFKTYRLMVADHIITALDSGNNSIRRVYPSRDLVPALDILNKSNDHISLGEFCTSFGLFMGDMNRASKCDIERVSHRIRNIRMSPLGDILGDVEFIDSDFGRVARKLFEEPNSTYGFCMRSLIYAYHARGIEIRDVKRVIAFDFVQYPTINPDPSVPHDLERFMIQ